MNRNKERGYYFMRSIKKIFAVLVSVSLLFSAVMVHSASVEAAKKISLSQKKLTLNVGGSKKLTLKNLPKNHKIKWSSSNKKVAAVSATGKVTAKKAGKADIIATVQKKR